MVMVDSLRFLYYKYNYCNLFLISLIPYVVPYVSNEFGTTRHDAIQWDTMQCNATRCNSLRHWNTIRCNSTRVLRDVDNYFSNHVEGL